MESQDKEKEYEHNVWEIYRKEWATASPEKKTELNKRMRRWQELMNSGLPAQQAYYKAMEEELYSRVEEEPSGKQVAIPSAPHLRKAPVIFLSLALVAAIVYSIVTTMDRNTLNTELESVQIVLASTQSELGSTKETLASTQSELASTQSELASTQLDLNSTEVELSSTKETIASTQSELASTQLDIDSTEVELSSTKQKLFSTQTELSSTKQTLTQKQSELDDAKAEVQLYQETFGARVYAGKQPTRITGGPLIGSANLNNNTSATNPTWGELIEFLLNDPTDDNYYNSRLFNCVSFAEMLHNSAEIEGLKSAFVAINFKDNEIGHAVNAFITSDRGLVYVESQGGTSLEALQLDFYSAFYGMDSNLEYDKIAYVMTGEEFGVISINKATSQKYSYYEQMGNSLSDWLPTGIVESIEIYW